MVSVGRSSPCTTAIVILMGLQVDVTTEVDAFAGREASFRLRAAATIRVWTARDVEVCCRPPSATALEFARVAAKSSATIHAVALPVPQRRGVIRLEPVRRCAPRHPFGWFHAWTYVQGSLTAYVAPSPQRHPNVAGRRAEAGSKRPARRRAAMRISPACVPTSPACPLKHMAWKVLARGGEAAVRSLQRPGRRGRSGSTGRRFEVSRPRDSACRSSAAGCADSESRPCSVPYGLRNAGGRDPAGAGPAASLAAACGRWRLPRRCRLGLKLTRRLVGARGSPTRSCKLDAAPASRSRSLVRRSVRLPLWLLGTVCRTRGAMRLALWRPLVTTSAAAARCGSAHRGRLDRAAVRAVAHVQRASRRASALLSSGGGA
jgi:hypothetical protein